MAHWTIKTTTDFRTTYNILKVLWFDLQRHCILHQELTRLATENAPKLENARGNRFAMPRPEADASSASTAVQRQYANWPSSTC